MLIAFLAFAGWLGARLDIAADPAKSEPERHPRAFGM